MCNVCAPYYCAQQLRAAVGALCVRYAVQTRTAGQSRINRITAARKVPCTVSASLAAVLDIPGEYARVGGRVVSVIKAPLRKQRLYCVLIVDAALNS